MKALLGFLSLVILLGAGCAANEPSFSTSVELLDIQTTELTETAGTTWIMSSGYVLFTAPEGWSVTQVDGGSVSGIRVYSDDEEVRITVALQDDGSVEVATEMSGDSDELNAMVDSIVINPSVEAQVGATIIK